MADPASSADLCPSCGRHPITDDATGWCSQCADKCAVERYWEKDHPIVEARRDDWKSRTQLAAGLRERQHKHRLITNTRPQQLPHRDTDPLELCWEALEHLARVRQALRSNVVGRAHLDEAEELVKRLRWGPEPRWEQYDFQIIRSEPLTGAVEVTVLVDRPRQTTSRDICARRRRAATDGVRGWRRRR